MAAWKSAQEDRRIHRFARALATCRKLVQQYPGVPQLWAELAMAAMGEADFVQADQAFQRAAELAPNDAALLLAIGMRYYRFRRLDQAGVYFERAAAAGPHSIEAQLNLASWHERNRRVDEAAAIIEACLTRQPGHPRSRYLQACILNVQGLKDEAERALRALLQPGAALPPDVQADASHLLAVLLDERGEYGEAWRHLSNSKTIRRIMHDVPAFERIGAKMSQTRRALLGQLTAETVRTWRARAPQDPAPPVLLGGAPRSGTTLVEEILSAHPDIVVFDESEAFGQGALGFLNPVPPGSPMTLASLDQLSGTPHGRLLERYFKFLRGGGAEVSPQKLIVDKNPSTTAALPVWLRVFPRSKIVIALRDPRDVVVSCFFQNIPLTWANASFLDLEKTARFYADYMDVWLRLKELGGFDWVETRYEDTVAALEAEGKKIMNFLGLEWRPEQATYYEKSGRKFLHAPTYQDVAKPVYRRAVGRWRHYEAMLAPLQSVLDKYIKTFGYDS